MENLTSIWDFVEKYHPNYYRCDSVLRINDLEKEKEDDPENFGNQPELDSELSYVYAKAIQGFIDSQTKTDEN